ncbi:kelch-like protein 26 isoform X2 [Lineus longissimus]
MPTEHVKINDTTELVKFSDNKHKYNNRTFTKVKQKMFDYTCDIRLKVDSEMFQAHKEVLGDASDYFAAMFSVDMKEKEQDMIELYDISPTGFSALLEYFYHGHIAFTADKIEDIIEASRFFHVEWLIEVCCDFLVRHLSIENYYQVLQLADKYYLGDLRIDIFRHVGRNFQHMSSQLHFMNISYDLLHQLLSDDFFIEAPENIVLNTVLNWVDHDNENRHQHLFPLLKEVRFALVDPEFIRGLGEEILGNEDIAALLEKAKEYHEKPYQQCLEEPENVCVRGSHQVIALISAVEEADSIQFKVPGTEGFYVQAMDTTHLDVNFEFARVGTMGNFLFVAGGYCRNYCSSAACYRYDPRNGGWLEIAPMNLPRVSFGFATSQDSLFSVAGVLHVVDEDDNDQESFLSSAERYDPVLNTWHALPDIPYRCSDCAVAVCGNNVFVSGGISDDVHDPIPVNYVVEYTPGDETWTPKSPMLNQRQGHSMLGHKGKIYCFGGYTAQNEISFGDCYNNELFDLETEQWSAICSTPRVYGHLQPSITIFEDTIYFIGGSFTSRHLYGYNTDTDEISEGEYCGVNYQKLATLKIGLPYHLLPAE